jgi:hypothetical protein
LRGKTLVGNGILLNQNTDADVIVKGFHLYLQRFPTLVKYYNVRFDADGTFNATDFRQVAFGVMMIRVGLGINET